MILSFWMKDTLIPLDVAFLDGDMRIQQIVRNMVPRSEETIQSTEPAQYALEVNAGYFDSNGIVVGDKLFFN